MYTIQSCQQTLAQFKNRPLVGVYHLQTRSITLFPCVKEKIILEPSRYGKYQYFKVNYAPEIEPKSPDFHDELRMGYAPRMLDDHPKYRKYCVPGISAHQYLLIAMNEIHNQESYRGFTIQLDSTGHPTYTWVSASLNSPLSGGKKIRQSGAQIQSAAIRADIQKQLNALCPLNQGTSTVNQLMIFTGEKSPATYKAPPGSPKKYSEKKMPEKVYNSPERTMRKVGPLLPPLKKRKQSPSTVNQPMIFTGEKSSATYKTLPSSPKKCSEKKFKSWS